MHSQSMKLNDAFDFVRRRKANISPNFNFMGQLLDFEHKLNLSPSVPCPSCAREGGDEEPFLQSEEEPTRTNTQAKCRCHTLHFMTSPPKETPDSGIGF
ncbi:unnamed protein product [Cyprideis torosa]|uniref:protein-tyrosine-phosphatase n=1 Tax=Cyprideis torosa TaxID=163714 RepID=A0A7R8WYC9_9CRUS|nr:unnamed protein product [Cyprideis torosa]CAG0909717.1 unnamed protein product [Cyprideis torosa]